MGKIGFGLVFVIGVMFTLSTESALTSQLATHPNDLVSFGINTSDQWISAIEGRSDFGFDKSGRMLALENKKTGIDGFARKRPEIEKTTYIRSLDAKDVNSSTNAGLPQKDGSAKEEAVAPEPQSLPNAFWLFGLGIMAIISIRRTSDYSNVT